MHGRFKDEAALEAAVETALYSFSKRFGEVPHVLGLKNMKAFADTIGKSQQSFSDVAKGNTYLKLHTFIKIHVLYPDLSFNWLLLGVGEPLVSDELKRIDFNKDVAKLTLMMSEVMTTQCELKEMIQKD